MVLDPIEDVSLEERQRLYHLLPCLYFALIFLSSQRQGIDSLEKIALTPPHGVPDFSGFDLWLQRKALVCMLGHKGISFLLDNLHPELCLEPVYYAFLRMPLVRQRREDLIQKLKALSRTVPQSSEMYEDAVKYMHKIQSWQPVSPIQ
ncbi:MAG: hypothetical protein R6V55_12300 [Desulfovermiculus sp.]